MTHQIKWTRDDTGDYHATIHGIRFRIYRAVDGGRVRFALTARRLSDNKDLFPCVGGLPWSNYTHSRSRAERLLSLGDAT